MKLLFVNACLRGEESNTLKLCHAALQTLLERSPGAELMEADLAALHLAPFTGEEIKRRSALHADGRFDDEIYAYAREFAAADTVLIGAPYWDLSFPAALKVYLERVCAADLTFSLSPEGRPVGRCKARRLLYLTTSGGRIGGQNFGYDYVRALAESFFGIPKVGCFAVEGFDLGGDQAALLEAGRKDLDAFLREWL